MTKIAVSGSGPISQRHGSEDPDPDPPQMSWIRNTGFRGMDPDPYPDLDPSITKQKKVRKTLIPTAL
jgi:hypothetical protein